MGQPPPGAHMTIAEYRALESEPDFQKRVVKLAADNNWKIHHDLPITDKNGRTRTAVMGDVGFPDLVLARDGVVLFVELKSEQGDFGPGQRPWRDAIGESWRLWKPSDWPEIVATLEAPRP